MLYRYETHCHCVQASRCARSTAQELVRAYHARGYAGLVLTDHFIFGNTSVPRDLSWDTRMRLYHQAYLDAKREGDKLDFDVIFGIEHAYGDGKEVLIYGIDLPFLLNNPDIPEITLDEFAARVKAYGGIVVQAHPDRDRSYVNMAVGPRADLVDGLEIHNPWNQPGEDRKALALAGSGSYILTSGGDIHVADDPRLGTAGVLLPYRVRDEKQFVAALKQGHHICLVGGRPVDPVTPEDLP